MAKIFHPTDEPDGFDKDCRERGKDWIAANPKPSPPKKREKKHPSYWVNFLDDLYSDFRGLCGYCFLYDSTGGTVDHYISKDNDDDKAYEWSNYRLAMGRVNSSKKNADDTILDPFDADDEWIEVILPSLQYKVGNNVPLPMRAKVQFTLDRLKLNGNWMIKTRRKWFHDYLLGKMTLDGLRDHGPLIAKAVEALTPQEVVGYKTVAEDFERVEEQKRQQRRARGGNVP